MQIWPEFQIYKCSLTKCEQILCAHVRESNQRPEICFRANKQKFWSTSFFFSCALHIWLKTMSKHPGFLPFWFEQWDFFWLWMHCQSDCFSHIACRHLSFCSYCQEKLPHKLSEPNEYNFHTSFILEKEKRDIKNNPINNNCLHYVMIRTAKGARRTYFRNNNEKL